MSEEMRTVEHVTCLGCGCACDDITVVVRGGRIVEARRACPLGVRWFGDGSVPARVVGERGADLERALDDAAALLTSAERPLVYLATNISCETQRAAVAIADRLRAVLDSVSSATAAAGILAAQRRGRAGATLGEIRNRVDLLVFWGVDLERYPRYATRYAPEPEGLFVPEGRRGRTVVAVDVGEMRVPIEADVRVQLTEDEELDALAALRAAVAGRSVGDVPAAARTAELAERLRAAKYVAIVSDAEPSARRDAGRAEALIALTQGLNASTRCALSTLRAGGNRSGADVVLTWQTGFPMTVDFTRGFPRYRPDDGAAALLERGEIDAALVVGDADSLPGAVGNGLRRTRSAGIGPRASESSVFAVAIDTGVAGIHEGGTAYRMDDVPLPLRASLPTPRDTASTVRALGERVRRLERERRA